MKQDRLFNLFYINYQKAYEIATLIDNRIPLRSIDEKGKETSKYGDVLNSLCEGDELNVRLTTRNEKVYIDEYNYATSNSTVLETVNEAAREIDENSKLVDTKPETIVLLNNCRLEIVNNPEIANVKNLINVTLNNVSNGSGNANSPAEALLKDYAYVIEARCKDSFYLVTFKIPMTSENEFLSGYTVSDLEFGLFSIVGIYKGCFSKKMLYEKLNGFSSQQKFYVNTLNNNNGEMRTHYIDLIGIMQYIESCPVR